MPLQLTIQSGPDAGIHCPLPERETLLVGRGDACGLRLSDHSVSRIHCRLTLSDNKLILEDAGSRWGTLVNGEAVESRELQLGDRITIGDTELRVDREGQIVTTMVPARVINAFDKEPRPAGSGPDGGGNSERPLPAGRGSSSDGSDGVNPPRLADLVGESFLRYRVGSIIARTTSGMVFRALDTEFSRTVALKIYWPDYFSDERAAQRFLRAVKTMVPLEHDNLVKLHAAGRFNGLCFTASEFIEGESVTHVIARIGVAGMLDWRRAYQVAVGVAEALEFAHERNIIHRNIRPSNILIRDSDGCIKLGDLMLARAIDELGTARITRPGEVVGDARYLAPEQVSGETHVDGRADLYSLGATLYATLTGRPPFDGTTVELIGKILSQPPEPPTKYHLAIPPAFEGAVLKMLAKRPEDRFASATALLKDLRRIGKYLGA